MSVHVLWHEHMALHATRCLSIIYVLTYLICTLIISPFIPFPIPLNSLFFLFS